MANAFILRNSLIPLANKLIWLNIDLSTARTNEKLNIEGIGIATHQDYIANTEFDLKLIFKDYSSFILTQNDMLKIPMIDVVFKDIEISNISQDGKKIKLLILQHIPIGES